MGQTCQRSVLRKAGYEGQGRNGEQGVLSPKIISIQSMYIGDITVAPYNPSGTPRQTCGTARKTTEIVSRQG